MYYVSYPGGAGVEVGIFRSDAGVMSGFKIIDAGSGSPTSQVGNAIRVQNATGGLATFTLTFVGVS